MKSVDWMNERTDGKCKTFQNCFQGISGLGVYAGVRPKDAGLIWYHVLQYARNSQEKREQMIVGVALTELFHTTSVGAVCYF